MNSTSSFMALIHIVSTSGTTSMIFIRSFIKSNILKTNGSIIGIHKRQMQGPWSIIDIISSFIYLLMTKIGDI